MAPVAVPAGGYGYGAPPQQAYGVPAAPAYGVPVATAIAVPVAQSSSAGYAQVAVPSSRAGRILFRSKRFARWCNVAPKG